MSVWQWIGVAIGWLVCAGVTARFAEFVLDADEDVRLWSVVVWPILLVIVIVCCVGIMLYGVVKASAAISSWMLELPGIVADLPGIVAHERRRRRERLERGRILAAARTEAAADEVVAWITEGKEPTT